MTSPETCPAPRPDGTNWRCLLNDCPSRGEWQTAATTAEQAWTEHMCREHGWTTR